MRKRGHEPHAVELFDMYDVAATLQAVIRSIEATFEHSWKGKTSVRRGTFQQLFGDSFSIVCHQNSYLFLPKFLHVLSQRTCTLFSFWGWVGGGNPHPDLGSRHLL